MKYNYIIILLLIININLILCKYINNVNKFHLDDYLKNVDKHIPINNNNNNPPSLLQTNERVKQKLWFHLDNYLQSQKNKNIPKAGGTTNENDNTINFSSSNNNNNGGTNDPTSGGSTNLVRNHNYMSVMETADGRGVDPKTARAQFNLEKVKQALEYQEDLIRQQFKAEKSREKKAKMELEAQRHHEESIKQSKARVESEVKEAQELAKQTNERHRREFLAKQKKLHKEEKQEEMTRIILADNFSKVPNWQIPMAKVWNAYCFVTGAVKHKVSSKHHDNTDVLVGKLPSTCYPRNRVIFNLVQTATEGSENHLGMARVDVTTDGNVFWMANGLDRSGVLSLDGIIISLVDGVDLNLDENWSDFNDNSGLGKPLVRVKNDIVTLTGTIQSSANEWHEIATLPKEARPATNLMLMANNNDEITMIDVTNDGMLRYRSGGERQWISLDGILYPKRGGIPLPLEGKWRNYGNMYRIARHHRAGNICFATGVVAHDDEWIKGEPILTLPLNCRPPHKITILAAHGDDHTVRLEVNTKGQVVYMAGHQKDVSFLSLDTIRFLVK